MKYFEWLGEWLESYVKPSAKSRTYETYAHLVRRHKNPTVTLNRYVHSLLEHKAEMMNRLGKFL